MDGRHWESRRDVALKLLGLSTIFLGEKFHSFVPSTKNFHSFRGSYKIFYVATKLDYKGQLLKF